MVTSESPLQTLFHPGEIELLVCGSTVCLEAYFTICYYTKSIRKGRLCNGKKKNVQLLFVCYESNADQLNAY